jgi:uncharacterized protein
MILWSDLATVWLMAVLGGAHCAGMCLPFASLVALPPVEARGAGSGLGARTLAYHLGKGLAYATLGGGLLLASRWLATSAPLLRAQEILAAGTGLVLVLTGLNYALAWRPAGRLGDWLARGPLGTVCALIPTLRAAALWPRCFLVGWLNGLLPCGLSLGAVLFLGRGQSVANVFAGAFAFTLGTLPVLLLVGTGAARGWIATALGPRLRPRWLRVAGWLLVLMGLVTAVRGVDSLTRGLHVLVEWCVA